MAPNSSTPFRRRLDTAVSLAFLVAVCAPLVGTCLLTSSFDPSVENRPAAPFPVLRRATLAEYPAAFEKWFGDRFAFRRTLVRLEGLAKMRIGVSPSPLVVVGKDTWLFYAGERAVEQFRHTSPLAPAELARWREALEVRRDELAARGIHYLFVVAPNKETIYSEFMPRGLTVGPGPSRLDQLVEYLRANSMVEVLDLRPALQRARSTERVYHRTDTHWNDRGAYAAYIELADRLRRWYPDLKPVPRGALIEAAAKTPGGDLAGMLSLRADLPEDRLTLSLARASAAPAEPGVPVAPRTPPHAVPVAKARNDARLPRAMVLRDSYFEALIPFVSEHFDRTLYLFTHELDPEIVDRERPGVVMEEMLERYLMMAPPMSRPVRLRADAASRQP